MMISTLKKVHVCLQYMILEILNLKSCPKRYPEYKNGQKDFWKSDFFNWRENFFLNQLSFQLKNNNIWNNLRYFLNNHEAN